MHGWTLNPPALAVKELTVASDAGSVFSAKGILMRAIVPEAKEGKYGKTSQRKKRKKNDSLRRHSYSSFQDTLLGSPRRYARLQSGTGVPAPRALRADFKKSSHSGIPIPVLLETLRIFIPGLTRWMLASVAAASNSTASAKSILVITAISAVLKMVGYFSGLSSPSVTERSTRRRSSPRS